MIKAALYETLSQLTHKPVLWVPGLYTGIVAAVVIWLEFTGGIFLAGKIAMLAAIVFPFFVGILNEMLHAGVKEPRGILSAGAVNYFRIILPVIILAGLVLLMALMLSIPLSIMGFGEDPYILSGLFIGISVPTVLFSLYLDNIAVCEKTRIFQTLRRSMELVGRDVMGSIGYLVISGIVCVIVSFFGAFLWGVLLSDRFTPYVDMNITAQQETFQSFTLADWQNLIGPDGTAITALVFGLVIGLLTPFLLVFKYNCYQGISQKTPEIPQGEYDEKGRWYKY